MVDVEEEGQKGQGEVLKVGSDGGLTQEAKESVENDAVGHFFTFSCEMTTDQCF